MHLVRATSINDAFINCVKLIDFAGVDSSSKANTGVIATNRQVYNVNLKIDNPRLRYLDVIGRNNNIFAMIAESFWTLAGRNDINPYLSFFLPRAGDFSDDGLVWRAGYGPRLYAHDQVQCVIDDLRKNPSSRQACIGIADPHVDTKTYLPNGTKDIPCNRELIFSTGAWDTNSLNLHIIQRSGDVIWGFGSINIFLWTIFQEIIANAVGMKMGYYTHYCHNLHVYKSYDVAYKQFQSSLNSKAPYERDPKAIDRFHEVDQEDIRSYFGKLVDLFTQYIKKELTAEEFYSKLQFYFIGQTDDAISDMIKVVAGYAVNKIEGENTFNITAAGIDVNLVNAANRSKFKNFQFE